MKLKMLDFFLILQCMKRQQRQLGTYYLLLIFYEKDLKNIEVQRQYNRLLSGI